MSLASMIVVEMKVIMVGGVTATYFVQATPIALLGQDSIPPFGVVLLGDHVDVIVSTIFPIKELAAVAQVGPMLGAILHQRVGILRASDANPIYVILRQTTRGLDLRSLFAATTHGALTRIAAAQVPTASTRPDYFASSGL